LSRLLNIAAARNLQRKESADTPLAERIVDLYSVALNVLGIGNWQDLMRVRNQLGKYEAIMARNRRRVGARNEVICLSHEAREESMALSQINPAFNPRPAPESAPEMEVDADVLPDEKGVVNPYFGRWMMLGKPEDYREEIRRLRTDYQLDVSRLGPTTGLRAFDQFQMSRRGIKTLISD
jgi:alkanesulfonate monooxygenase SsuD/methylene tetrahydromethanopterin reductase-like flavin-dependent oxidoreductase (luciferase family)